MARSYTLKRRAEQQADTRQRIVDVAIELHGTVGPAATTISMLAERAGVQRHTVYAHFPDDRSLLMACSGQAMERSPLPDAAPWRGIADARGRLHAGLRALYRWYEENSATTACVLRDAEHHALVREIAELGMGPAMKRYGEVLGQGLNARQRALLKVALGFHSWRILVRDAGLKNDAAVASMADAVMSAA